MNIVIILSLVLIVFSVAAIALNAKTTREYERIKNKIPRKLYMQVKTKGVCKARLLLYVSYPLVALGWLDPEKVIEKAMSFIKIDTKLMS